MEKINRSAKKAWVKGVTRGQLKHFLAEQQSYSLQKPATRHCKRNPTYVKGIDALWQADLADMQSLSRDNKVHKFINTVIEIFSKPARAIPKKNMSGKERLTAVKQLSRRHTPGKQLDSTQTWPKNLSTGR